MKFENLENKKYDAWLHWYVTAKCNINCEYCFGHTNENIPLNRIDIEALSNTLNKSGNIFRISFTGGEPFLIPNFIEAAEKITEKHFISFNTHLLSNKISEFAKRISVDRTLVIHASLHIDELIRLKQKEKFVEHYQILKQKGFNIYAEAVAYPKFAPNVNEIISEYSSYGIDFSFAPFYGNYKGKKYPEGYTEDELMLFKIDKNYNDMFNQHEKYCNAGHNVGVVFSKGNIKPCFQLKNDIGNIYDEINFTDSGLNCPFKICGCPLNEYDSYLYQKSKASSKN